MGMFCANGVQVDAPFFDNRPASKEAATEEVWIYDYRTNLRHALKRKPPRFGNPADTIAC